MTYDRFITTLNTGIEGRVLAYDECDGNLQLLIRDGLTKVVVDKAVLDKEPQEAVYALRSYIRAGQWESDEVVLTLRDGELHFQVAEVV